MTLRWDVDRDCRPRLLLRCLVVVVVAVRLLDWLLLLLLLSVLVSFMLVSRKLRLDSFMLVSRKLRLDGCCGFKLFDDGCRAARP